MASAKHTVDLARLGGEEGIGRWVRRFYDRIGAHPLLAHLFRDLEQAKEKQHAYFVEFFGGPRRYTERFGRPFLRYQHRHFRIGQAERDAWMALALASLREEIDDGEVLAEVERRLGAIADAMINHHPEKKDAYYFQS
jgi:hemoglobin